MSFIMRPVRFAPTEYIIEGSGLFDGSTGYLRRSQDGGNRKTWTAMVLYKGNQDSGYDYLIDAGNNSPANNTHYVGIVIRSTNRQLNFSSATTGLRLTTQPFRDYSGWSQFVFQFDTTNSTAANRHRLWHNGVEITGFATSNNLALNHELAMNESGQNVTIGNESISSGAFAKMYMAANALYDGVVIDGDDPIFGELTDDGFWQINDFSQGDLTGANSHLIVGGTDMAAGTDSSGNSNNFSKTGTITATNDSPTNGGA